MIERLAAESVKSKVEEAVKESAKENLADRTDFDIDKFLDTRAEKNDKITEDQAESKDDVVDPEKITSSTNDSPAETDDQTEQTKSMDQSEKPYEVVRTINSTKEGQEFKGVRFVRKIVDLGDRIIEGVFPVFESVIDVQLPKEKYKSSDESQGKYCTEQLKKALEQNPALAKQFTPRQMEAINDKKSKIPGFIWHHNEELGKMQLVDSTKHSEVRHTGGASLWAGRNEK